MPYREGVGGSSPSAPTKCVARVPDRVSQPSAHGSPSVGCCSQTRSADDRDAPTASLPRMRHAQHGFVLPGSVPSDLARNEVRSRTAKATGALGGAAGGATRPLLPLPPVDRTRHAWDLDQRTDGAVPSHRSWNRAPMMITPANTIANAATPAGRTFNAHPQRKRKPSSEPTARTKTVPLRVCVEYPAAAAIGHYRRCG